MKPAEKLEVAALAAVAGWALFAPFPPRVALADLLLGGAAFLLLQGLLRDLWRLRSERGAASAVVRAPLRCVCLESTVGVGAIVSGCLLLFGWAPIVLDVSRFTWPAGIAALGAFGFLTRNLVLDWTTRRLRRDPHHGTGAATPSVPPPPK